jgi:4-amino-4-deoxy-L-arabinose transferase-like glycosyltransferase
MHAPLQRPLGPGWRVEAGGVVALVALGAAVLVWRWVGFQGHDDAYYATAALAWVRHFPALGTEHWALRYPLVLPMAACLAVFGHSLGVLALPNLVAYVAWLGVTYWCMREWFGLAAAMFAMLAGILVPEFPVQATYANPDILELALVMGAFWCHQSALSRADRVLPLLHCGALAGLAFLTRETSAALVLYFAIVAVFRPGMPRRSYALIALTFAVVVGVEFAYFGLRTGDFLYRVHLSINHDHVDRAAQAAAAAAAGHALDSEGVLAGGPVFQLFSVLFISQKYGLLFWLAPVAAWFALRDDRLMPRERRVLIDACVLGLAFIVFIAVTGSKLYIVPRYFTVSGGAAIIPVAAAAACLWRAAPRVAGAAAAAFAVLMLALLAVENTDPLFAVRRLVAFAGTTDAQVFTDPTTASEAAIPLLFAHLQGRVRADAPPPGALVAMPEGSAAACCSSRTCGFKDRMGPFIPGPGWSVVRREPATRPLLGNIARLIPHLPKDIARKLEAPNASFVVWRTAPDNTPQPPAN